MLLEIVEVYFFISYKSLKPISQHAHIIHAAHVILESDSHAVLALMTGPLAVHW